MFPIVFGQYISLPYSLRFKKLMWFNTQTTHETIILFICYEDNSCIGVSPGCSRLVLNYFNSQT